MEIRDIVRRGYGSGVGGSDGSIAAVVTRGYTPDQTVGAPASGIPAGAILLLVLFTELQPR